MYNTYHMFTRRNGIYYCMYVASHIKDKIEKKNTPCKRSKRNVNETSRSGPSEIKFEKEAGKQKNFLLTIQVFFFFCDLI